jgi:ribonuclease BN (tRNA processing enzyme)
VAVQLTVLGCSGSYGSAASGACSGYLVRSNGVAVWLDCGNGTFDQLQRHISIDDLDAVVITHAHPDHCVDVYGLHVLMRYGLGREGLPVYGPEGLSGLLGTLVRDDWGNAFDWHVVGDGDTTDIGGLVARFSRTDHPPPTLAVELSAGGKRLVYTADTGPGWEVGAFDAGADLVLSEATYLRDDRPTAIHITAHEAGLAARAAGARRLVITHVWPTVPVEQAVLEAAESFGDTVTNASQGLVVDL